MGVDQNLSTNQVKCVVPSIFSCKMKVVTESTHKKRKYSKNKKKNWRKHVDISDIEAHQEDIRREERYGGQLSEQKDEEFMFMDLGDPTDGDIDESKIKVSDNDILIDTEPGSKSEGKSLQQLKKANKKNTGKLNCHKFLDGLPGAKKPITPYIKPGQVTAAKRKIEERKGKDPKVAKKLNKDVKQLEASLLNNQKKKTNESKVFRKNLWDPAQSKLGKFAKKGLWTKNSAVTL